MAIRDHFIPWLRLSRRWCTGLVLIYVGTSLTVGGAAGAKMIVYALAACWGGFLLAGRWRGGRLGSGRLRVLEVLATNLAFTLVLAELGLRGYAAWTGRSIFLDDSLDAHRLVPGHDYGGGLRGNRLGYPGRDFESAKRPGTFRIAALGDSFAVGPAVPFADNYLTLLETHLAEVEVYNFGVSGTGPREYQAILGQHVWNYHPDLILVSVFVGNDITERMSTPRHLDPRCHALYLLLTRSWRLARERWRQERPALATTSEPAVGPALSEQTFQEVEARRLWVCRTAAPPDLENQWVKTLGHLRGIITDCRRHQTPVAFVLIPDEFQVNPAVLAAALAGSFLERDDLDLELPQHRLAEFFTSHDAPCLDLLPFFRETADTYKPRDTHWNARGNRLAAHHIARWLAEEVRTGRGTRP